VCANIKGNENVIVSRHMMQDGLVVGVILFLLIAALGVYVWLRFQQIETRLSIAESISVDMKMILQQYSQFPSVPETNIPAAELASPTASAVSTTYKSSSTSNNATVRVTKIDSDEPEMVLETLTELVDAEPMASDSMFPSVVDEVKREMNADNEGSSGINIVDMNALKSDYNNMTMKDLRTLAKSRGITGTGSMNRQQIVAALKEKDSEVVEYEAFNADEDVAAAVESS
jgi:hypothetical protein